MVTRRFDPHADVVIAGLEKIGVEAFRINTEDFLDSHTISWESDAGCVRVSDGYGRSVSLPAGILSCYMRRPLPVAPHHGLLDAPARAFAASEGESLIESLYALSGIRWVSSPRDLRAAEPKLPQLRLAQLLGLRVPRTLVTNNPKDALEFARTLRSDIAVKPLRTSSIEVGDLRYDLYTRRMTTTEFARCVGAVQYSPCILQEFVPKEVEYRVTIMGPDLFATEIDSRAVAGAQTDWREVDAGTVRYCPVQLPVGLQEALRAFLQRYGLEFGAIDLVRTPDGEFVFLENNPNGVWYWLELATGQPMAASMARLLTRTRVGDLPPA